MPIVLCLFLFPASTQKALLTSRSIEKKNASATAAAAAAGAPRHLYRVLSPISSGPAAVHFLGEPWLRFVSSPSSGSTAARSGAHVRVRHASSGRRTAGQRRAPLPECVATRIPADDGVPYWDTSAARVRPAVLHTSSPWDFWLCSAESFTNYVPGRSRLSPSLWLLCWF
jgi:hypothetical protein